MSPHVTEIRCSDAIGSQECNTHTCGSARRVLLHRSPLADYRVREREGGEGRVGEGGRKKAVLWRQRILSPDSFARKLHFLSQSVTISEIFPDYMTIRLILNKIILMCLSWNLFRRPPGGSLPNQHTTCAARCSGRGRCTRSSRSWRCPPSPGLPSRPRSHPTSPT